MLKVRTLRPFVCLLLAVTTAAGTAAAPLRACECTTRRAAPVTVPASVVAVAEPAPPRCGHCCPSAANAPCCCRTDAAPVPHDRPAVPTPAGCACARCDCDHPARLPDAPPPTDGPTPDQFTQFGDAVPLPVFLAAPRPTRPVGAAVATSPAPADLVLVLSRRTC